VESFKCRSPAQSTGIANFQVHAFELVMFESEMKFLPKLVEYFVCSKVRKHLDSNSKHIISYGNVKFGCE